jgi:4-amino-4-deoxy-L-arabinose transferase-like glycosyltransferase
MKTNQKNNQVYYKKMTRKSSFNSAQSYLGLYVGLGLIFLIIGFLPFLDIEQQKNLLAEGGLFESLTVYLYIFCLILICIRWPLKKILSNWYLSALIILFALRELDYDKAHFTHGVLKSRQYFSDLVGLPELLISIVVLIIILTVLALIVLKERNDFIKGVINLMQSQLAILASIILVIITKTIDGMERKFGIDLSPSGERFAHIVEEVGEMGIPIMFAIAILSWRNKSQT